MKLMILSDRLDIHKPGFLVGITEDPFFPFIVRIDGLPVQLRLKLNEFTPQEGLNVDHSFEVAESVV